MTNCSCGLRKNYAECCGRFINGQQLPGTPEELMRSRYTAYTLANIDYIDNTMKSPASDHFDAKNAYQWAKSVEWDRLEVLHSSQADAKGFVEFKAYFKQDNRRQILHEESEFHLIDGKWYYVDGKIPDQK